MSDVALGRDGLLEVYEMVKRQWNGPKRGILLRDLEALREAGREEVKALERLGIVKVVKFRRRGKVVFPAGALRSEDAGPETLPDVLLGRQEGALSDESRRLLEGRDFRRTRNVWWKKYGTGLWKKGGVVITVEETGGLVWLVRFGPACQVDKMGSVGFRELEEIIPVWDDWFLRQHGPLSSAAESRKEISE